MRTGWLDSESEYGTEVDECEFQTNQSEFRFNPNAMRPHLPSVIILWTCVQFVGAAITFVAPYFGQPPDPKFSSISQCSVGNSTNSTTNDTTDLDYINLFYFNGALFFLIVTAYSLLFWPRYRRVEAERRRYKQTHLQSTESSAD